MRIVWICVIHVLLLPPFRKDFSFELCLGSEVEQQTYLKFCRFEVIHQLCFVFRRYCLSSFQFENDFIVNQQVSEILTDRLFFLEDLDRDLLFHRTTVFGQFLGKGIFINFLEKAISKHVVDTIESIDNIRCDLFMKHDF